MAAHQAPPSLGFSRQEHWSGLPFPKKHFSVGMVSGKKLRKFIEHPTHKLTCINDVNIADNRYEELRSALLDAFESKFPDKCKYEL